MAPIARDVAYRFGESSSDVVLETEASTPAQALVEVARAFTHVTTNGSRVRVDREHGISVGPTRSADLLAVAFVNELTFLFDTEGFLAQEGELRIFLDPGAARAEGVLRGDTFDPKRHQSGTAIKAATRHGAEFLSRDGVWRVRVLVDL